MPDLSVKYMGFNIKNPLIAGSSELTSRVDSLLDLEKRGVSAVVLKSLFEEELYHHPQLKGGNRYPIKELVGEGSVDSKEHKIGQYLDLIDAAKQNLTIPVIASINCITNQEWTSLARRIESAGADALELNIFTLPSDPMKSSEENEKVYIDILNDLKRQVKIPISVKISPYFSGMTKMALRLSWTGISGMVLFNRFYQPDIDTEEIKTISGKLLSSPDEMALSLRWVALLSDRVMCDVAGATGVHDHTGIIKLLLAGAKAVQVVSAFYIHGNKRAEEMLDGLSQWMVQKEFQSIGEFCGKLSLKKNDNPADYERYQYFKAFHPDD
jgi:dihydroorotate dehydrogenase (fumarate)